MSSVLKRLSLHSSLVLVFQVMAYICAAQQVTTVKGKITDAASGDPIPFATVVFRGTTIGTNTDFDGNYSLTARVPVDSLIASYMGYKSKAKAVTTGVSQIINIQLDENVTNLREVVVTAGENPAYKILRNIIRNKNKNDKRKLSAYEYDTYTKIEIDVDHITDKFREKKIVKKITQVLDSVGRIAGEDGKPVLPIFISESVSKLYYRDNPKLTTENILKSKINGIGIEDGTLVTQFIGSSFQEYNFYQNWLNIVSKEFVSPIADGWRLYYDYDLSDSVYIEDKFCYRIDFFPRSPQELAFTGTMWITRDEYALRRIDASVGKQANLNFVEKIRIQQELAPTEEGAWLPYNNRVLIDIGEINDNLAGMLAKFYTSNKNFVINKPYEPSFYEHPIVMAEDARMNQDENYWDSLRHEPLSETEKNVYQMIDTLQHIPVVRTYTDIIKILVNGYYKAGKFYIGPYIGLMAVNNIEGFRLQAGFKTNIEFSKKWVIGAQLGYGFKDERIKYSAFVQNILSRERWTTMSIRVRSDIGRVGIDDENLADNYLFLAAQRWGFFRRGYYFNETRWSFQREIFKGFTQRVSVKYNTFKPTFNFGYYSPENNTNDVRETYETAEVSIESRYARDELFIQDDNDRISLGTTHWPIITLRYTKGIAGIVGSDFNYQKLRLSVYKSIRCGPLGVGYLTMNSEYVFDKLPYTLLAVHLGNQTPIFTHVTYNLMNYGEFVSDRYASLHYSHHMEGFILNHIPLIRKLKWRFVETANIIYGGLSQGNRALIAQTTPAGEVTELPGNFTPGKPYIELGYGIENIFKFFRIDFIHRLSYLNKPNVRKFGVFASFQFNL